MRIPLLGSAYEARSIIASAQRCVNLYAEVNPQSTQPPVPVTHYPTPGLRLLRRGPGSSARCLYQASNGDLYTVIGSTVYYVTPNFVLQALGSITGQSTPCYMADNGLVIVLVDGTANGYAIDMTTKTFGAISSTNFYGANRVQYLDTYFLFNRPGTAQWYISLSEVTYTMLTNGTAFDPLDIAAKTGYPDPIVAIVVMHREIWLIGTLTTEIWYNSGAADFTFQILPGTNIIEHGCVAPYSIANQDLSIYWLSQDKQGRGIVLRGAPYEVLRISTNAIENEFMTYPTITDAVGYTYQQEGHTFFVLNFPTANKTWVYDQSTELWHERAWTDSNGNLDRHRANVCAYAYSQIVTGDWQNGNLYALDLDTYTDNGNPISRIRSFPHLLDDGKRVIYNQFIADMQVGTDDGSGGLDYSNPPVVSLRWSDTAGASWGNRIEQSLGATGEYLTNIQFQRLGMARDRVFELSWSIPTKTALNGAFIQKITALT